MVGLEILVLRIPPGISLVLCRGKEEQAPGAVRDTTLGFLLVEYRELVALTHGDKECFSKSFFKTGHTAPVAMGRFLFLKHAEEEMCGRSEFLHVAQRELPRAMSLGRCGVHRRAFSYVPFFSHPIIQMKHNTPLHLESTDPFIFFYP